MVTLLCFVNLCFACSVLEKLLRCGFYFLFSSPDRDHDGWNPRYWFLVTYQPAVSRGGVCQTTQGSRIPRSRGTPGPRRGIKLSGAHRFSLSSGFSSLPALLARQRPVQLHHLFPCPSWGSGCRVSQRRRARSRRLCHRVVCAHSRTQRCSGYVQPRSQVLPASSHGFMSYCKRPRLLLWVSWQKYTFKMQPVFNFIFSFSQ